jgi:alpha-beta hydrolase superfamily lysophospholipase
MTWRKYDTGRYSPVNYATDGSYLMTPSDWVVSASSRAIIGCHGRSNDATMVGKPPLDQYSVALLNAGYVIFGIDHARINSWGDPDAMRALDDAYTFITTTLGITNTKVGLTGASMGGSTSLNWIKRNTSKVACAWLWNPVTDLNFFQSAGYVAPYGSLNGVAPGAYAGEINTTYQPSTTAVGTATIPAVGGTPVTVNVANAKSFADGHNNANVGKPQAIVATVAFTYTGKTDTSLTGCVSTTGAPIAVTNGAAVTTTAYTTQSNGYRVQDEPTQWANNGVPVMIYQASDDTTVPPGQNTDGTQGFVARVGAANVTLRSPLPTGGHVNSISQSQVPLSEVVSFFKTNLA